MTLTRSFLQTYFVLSDSSNIEILGCILPGLEKINKQDYIEAHEPSAAEKLRIRTTIKHSDSSISFFDTINRIFDELTIPADYREALFEATKIILREEPDYESIKELIEFNYDKMSKIDK